MTAVVATLVESQRSQRRLTIVKFGGGVIGDHGQGIPVVVDRIVQIRARDGLGPLVVVSAPKGLTNRTIEMGRQVAAGRSPDVTSLLAPYHAICAHQMREPYATTFLDTLAASFDEARTAFQRVGRNREFEAGDRAIILAHCGELLMAITMDHVLRSHGVNSYNVPFPEWPLITDKKYASATFLRDASMARVAPLVRRIEEDHVVTMGGFVGRTTSGRETTFERGGSDRSAIDLGVLLTAHYDVLVDLEKESVVLSVDPNVHGITADAPAAVERLSYNEARLAGQYGMHIVDPIAIRDVPHDVNLLIHITNAHTGRRTVLQRDPVRFDADPIKIVTGRQNCAILECAQAKSASIYDFLEGVNHYYEFTELRPYAKDGVRLSRLLFFDGHYLRDHLIDDLRRIDDQVQVEYGLAAVTLVGDGMAQASGIAASTYEAIREKHPDLVILDGDIQRPTSSILMVIRDQDKDRCVSAIHLKRVEINRRSLQK